MDYARFCRALQKKREASASLIILRASLSDQVISGLYDISIEERHYNTNYRQEMTMRAKPNKNTICD